MRDFFFDMPPRGPITLTSLLGAAHTTTANYFNASLERLLDELPGRRLTVLDDSDQPDFATLLEYIDPQTIGRLLIGVRADRNSPGLIDCQLWLLNGIVCIEPAWCLSNPSRVADLEATLLDPIAKHGLGARTWLNRYDGPCHADWVRLPSINAATIEILRAMVRAVSAPARRSLLRII
ncbi:MAG: hypothetical protein K0U93_26490 [Gammaproteobacteria bacterium]|nr:hypothetical protein [Gammaproteobacteria bacterium]